MEKKHYAVKRANSAFFQVGADGICRYPAVGDIIELTPEAAPLLIAGGWVDSKPSDSTPSVIGTSKPAAAAAAKVVKQ
jgi:hypothetical protein